MSSSFEKQLVEADQLIVHGKLKEAYEMINESLKNKKIGKEEELCFLAYKSELEFYFGNFDESIKLADKILKESKGVGNPLLTVDALTWKAISFFYNGKISDCLEAFKKGSTEIFAAKDFPAQAIAKRKAQILSWQAVATTLLGDFNKGLELAKEATSFAERSEYKNVICFNLLILVDCHARLREWERVKVYAEKALAIANELENKFLEAFSYYMLTRGRNRIKESEIVEELFKKALSLAREVGAKILFIAKHDFGIFYQETFQFDKALKYYHETLEFLPNLQYMTTANIGFTYYMKYDLKQAQDYFLKSLRFCEEMNDRYVLPGTLWGLIEIALELNNPTQAKEYLKRLKELKEETGFEQIDHIYRYASILIMKASGNMSDLVKAAELLNDFLAEERYGVIGRLSILYSLLEIRLKELQFSPNEENLKEVQKRLHHLEVEADERQDKWFLANVFRLQSQLALVELDINKALGFLDKAQVIADEINVELLKKRIREDRKKIDQQLTMVQKFQEQKAPISETLKLVSLENTVKNIKRETVLEERDEETGEIIEYRKLFALKI